MMVHQKRRDVLPHFIIIINTFLHHERIKPSVQHLCINRFTADVAPSSLGDTALLKSLKSAQPRREGQLITELMNWQ